MLQAPAIVVGMIFILVLASGLFVLCRRGADDLEAWGQFVSRILRGDNQSGHRPPRRPGKQTKLEAPAVERADDSESPTR
jgi:hypothetical protein